MSSAAGTAAEQQEGKGTKRGPEETMEKRENEPANGGDQTGPPPTKTAKPNPSPSAGGAVVEVKAEGTGTTTDSERVEAEALGSLGLAVGTRLEVMWLLEDDDKSVEKVSERPNDAASF